MKVDLLCSFSFAFSLTLPLSFSLEDGTQCVSLVLRRWLEIDSYFYISLSLFGPSRWQMFIPANFLVEGYDEKMILE